MQLEGLRRSRRSPNLTPLIDIVFLLLIFFMLTSHFVDDESISIELPHAESAIANEQDDVIEIVLDAQGKIRIAGEDVEAAELEEKLRLVLAGSENKWVTLRGDQQADLSFAVNVLDAARKAGAESVDIITQQPVARMN